MVQLVLILMSIAVTAVLMVAGANYMQPSMISRSEMRDKTVVSLQAASSAYRAYVISNRNAPAPASWATDLAPYTEKWAPSRFNAASLSYGNNATYGDYFCYTGSGVTQAEHAGLLEVPAQFPIDTGVTPNQKTVVISYNGCGKRSDDAIGNVPASWPASVYLTFWLKGDIGSSGGGGAGTASLSAGPTSLALTTATNTASATQIITITNNGTVGATGVSATRPSGSAYFTFSTTCGATLAASGSCTATVMAKSIATAGTYSGNVTVAYSGGTAIDVPLSVTVTGGGSYAIVSGTSGATYTNGYGPINYNGNYISQGPSYCSSLGGSTPCFEKSCGSGVTCVLRYSAYYWYIIYGSSDIAWVAYGNPSAITQAWQPDQYPNSADYPVPTVTLP